MIERQIVSQKFNRHRLEEFIFSFLGKLSCSHLDLQKTPLGERIIVYTSKPGLIVGRKGANIKLLTNMLKEKFNMENPEIEVAEIPNAALDAVTVAKNIVGVFERYGPKRFKAISYKALDNLIKAGAKGAEIVVSGRGIPGVRAKTWRFSAGYLKKSGDISDSFVDKANEACHLKSGTIGIKVKILHPNIVLPDSIHIQEVIPSGILVEEVKESKNNDEAVKKEISEVDNKVKAKTMKTKKAETKKEKKGVKKSIKKSEEKIK